MQIARDTWIVFQHQLKITLRNPIFIIVGLFQPICQLLLYAPLLQTLANVPGFPSGGAYTVFTPGLLVMLAITSVLFVGFSFIAEIRSGVIERLRVTQASRLALVLGRSLCDVLMFALQALILLLTAYGLGLRANPIGVALTVVLMVLISLLMSLSSYAMALQLREENAFSSALNLLILPVLLLSGITLPLSLAPLWIQRVALLNPFAHAVEAARMLFQGVFLTPAVFQGFVIIGVLTVFAMLWAVRLFRQSVA